MAPGGGANRTRMALVAALALAAAVLLGGCASGGASEPDPGFSGQWILTSGRDADGSLALNGHLFTLTLGGSANGQMACRDFAATVSGRAAAKGGVVFVQAHPVGRQATCDDGQASKINSRFLAALRASTFARVGARSMTMDSQQSELRFVKNVTPQHPTLISAYWRLKTFPGTPVAQVSGPDRAPFVLRFPNGSGLEGGSRCFQMQATLERFTAVPTITTVESGYETSPCPERDLDIGGQVAAVLASPFIPSIDYDRGTRETLLTLTNNSSHDAAVFVADSTPQ